jgi:TPR repeat protein
MIEDEVHIDDSVIVNAKNGNGSALFAIGLEYYRLQSSKASNWFYLSTTRGSHSGYYFLGLMYHYGTGVNVDYIYAIEAYLMAAKHNTKPAFIKIGDLFNEGLGISLDKYKALEWYCQDQIEFSQTKTFTESKMVLKKQDKSEYDGNNAKYKYYYYLIMPFR